MLFRCLCVLIGAYSLGLCRTLPADDLFLAVVMLAAIAFRMPGHRAVGWFIVGFACMWVAAWINIDDRLDPAMQGETISIAARVVDFAANTGGSLRFIVEPQQRSDLPARIRLSWYEPAAIPGPGEVWQLRVRLRRPHGYANPGGFDYEGWLFRQRIGATGYVVSHKDNQRLIDIPIDPLSRIRQNFVDRVTRLLPADDAAAVLLAVGVGARHRITRAQWDRYAVTGTSHLMAISGLHIGLAAGGVMVLAWALLALYCRRINVRDTALVIAVLAAGMYAAVSGFAVPARRAFLMALLAAAAVLLRRKPDIATLLSIPCLVLFFADPVSIHAPGFKLSFAAVAILLWSLQRHVRYCPLPGGPLVRNALRNLCRLGTLQIVLLTGLFPLTVLIFGRFSVVAPLMNLLVLPIFNFVTVPFCLIGMIFTGPLQQLGDPLLVAAHDSIRLVLSMVSLVADLPVMRIAIHPPDGLAVALVCLPVMHVLFPSGWPGRKIAWIAIAAALLQRPAVPPPGCLDYHILDVGQGLAVVLRAGADTVLFDTGPSFRSGSSTADLVVIPFLRSRAISKLDILIVSHADQDHAGGVQAIASQFPIGRTLVGETVDGVSLTQSRCSTAAAWVSNGVRFQFLQVPRDTAWEGNNASCVLQVATGRHKLLLTGDIETPVEALLLKNSLLGRVNTVVVPHHGSRTSSSQDFVNALSPDLAIVSAGFGNRWGFPKTDVVRRWEMAGARLLETATTGAISQRICTDTGVETLRLERRDARKYWHEFSG